MADQKINALPVKTAPTTGDKMLMIGAAEEYQIDYDQLATAILNKLTSKTYALDQGTKTLIAALNELNSNSPVTVTVNASNTIKIQSLWDSTPTVAQERQTIFIFGLANGETVCGVICLFSSEPEASRFNGQGNVGVTLDSYGIITITLPHLSWDNFVLISGYPINFT